MRLKEYTPFIMRYGLALLFLASGVSKFFYPEYWAGFTARWALELLPIEPVIFIYLVGVAELFFSLTLFANWNVRIVAGIASAWLLLITINVLTAGLYDIALRDFGLVILAVGVAGLYE